MLIKYSTMKRCISLILATVLLISVFPMPAKATESALSDRIIVSLGDSYSSGEGIEPFYGQDDPLSEKVKNEDWLAHRSENAWSGMLTIPGVTGTMAENFDTHWFFAASSGAETKHLLEAQKKPYSKGGSLTGHWGSEAKVSGTEDVSPQLNVFGELDDRKADYVTMTLGGNDADFAGIITEVVLGSTYLNLSGLSDKLNKTWDKFYAEDGIGDKLSESYAAIAEKAGEQAHILVAGYPQLLDSTGIGFFVSKEEAQLVNTAVTNFNKAIEQVVNESRNAGINISFVSVEEAFSGHGAYSDDPYINEIMFGPILQEQDLKDIGVSSAYSIHPNYKGACAYAKCVQERIDVLEQERMFDETCWMWSKGVTAGSAYAVLFHLDGTLSYYKMNEDLLGSTTYEYKNGTLTIDGIDYTWQDDQFVSVEKFEVNGSAEPEDFNLHPDDQEHFYQFVSSFNVDHFVDEIQAEFGVASYTEFVSCIGAWFQEYPASIDGFITAVSVDLNADGKGEQLTLISKDQSIYLQVYSESNRRYVLSCESYITSLDYCSQQNISLFFNNEADRYLLFVDKNTAGAYTGFNGYFASLFSVTPSCIELYGSINEMDYNTEKEEIPKILQEFGVPYAQNCAEINNITSQSRYTELLEVKHRYFNADPMGGWAGREHHLQLLTPEKRDEPVDTVQSWTITMESYQGFTEYREETWTQEFETGKQYTILPMWKDGHETDYAILSYSVDTQERTIVIFMDYPEGSEYWKGLVLDLEDHTYYGLDYTEFW